jgi:hypothetical protein
MRLGRRSKRGRRQDTSAKVRLLAEGTYQADSWSQPRRVVYKAEALDKGLNLRFLFTTRIDPPDELYHWYTQRRVSHSQDDSIRCPCAGAGGVARKNAEG